MLALTTAPHLQVRRPSPTTAEFTVTTCPPPTISTRILLGIVHLARVLLALSALLLLHSTWTLSLSHRPDAISSTSASDASAQAIAAAGAPHFTNDGITTPTATDGHSTIIATIATSTTTHAPYPASCPPSPLPPLPTTLLTPDWAPYITAHLHASPLGRAPALLSTALPPWLSLALGLAALLLTAQRVHTTESLLVLRGLGIQTSSAGGSYLASWRAGTRFIPTEKIRDVLINEAFRGFAVRCYLVVVVDGEEDVVVVFPRLLPRRAIVERVWRGCRGCLWEPQDGGVGMRSVEEKNGAAGG